MIDIIVPCYNSDEKLLRRLLFSIGTQTIVDECNIILIDDCSDEEHKEIYNSLYNQFINFFNIKVITLENNSGPATARQVGIDNSDSEFIMFADSDDVFHYPNAVRVVHSFMKDDVDIVSSKFLEMGNIETYIHDSNDNIWLFAKLFRRSFLQEHNIRFTEGRRANEDSEFNFIACLYTDRIVYIDDLTYEWRHDNPNSIVTHDDGLYSLDQSFIGMCQIAIDINERYGDEFRTEVDELIINRMVHAYYGCIMASAVNPQFVEQSLYYAHKLYHYCWRDFDKELVRKIFCKISSHKYKADIPMPYMSFPQFLEFFKEHEFYEKDIDEIQHKLWNNEILKPMFDNNIKTGSVPHGYYG